MGVVFYLDIARSHTSIMTCQQLRKFGREDLIQPNYIWYGTHTSDYYLFLSKVNDLAGEKFALRKACENRLSQFLANSYERVCESDITKLFAKWQTVFKQNGLYLIQIGSFNLMQK